MTRQRAFAPLCGVQPGHRRSQNANVARGGAQLHAFKCVLHHRKHFGVTRRRVLAVKHLIADLHIFIGARRIIFLPPENFTRIGITRRFRPMGHMHLHHRHREIGPQHLFAAQRI